jgi:hypothetical protein
LDLKPTKSKPKPKKRIGQGTNKIKMIKKMKKKNIKKRVHRSVKDAINICPTRYLKNNHLLSK